MSTPASITPGPSLALQVKLPLAGWPGLPHVVGLCIAIERLNSSLAFRGADWKGLELRALLNAPDRLEASF